MNFNVGAAQVKQEPAAAPKARPAAPPTPPTGNALVPSDRFAELIQASTDQLNDVRRQVDAAVVDTPEARDKLIDTAKTAKLLVKAIEGANAEHYGKAKKIIADVNSIVKKWRDLSEGIERSCKDKINQFNRAESLRIEEENRKKLVEMKRVNALLEAEAWSRSENPKQAELGALAVKIINSGQDPDRAILIMKADWEKHLATLEKKKVAPPENVIGNMAPVIPMPQAEAPKTVRTDTGAKSTTVKTWTWDRERTVMEALISAADEKPEAYAKFLTIDEKALNQAIKDGVRQIPGIHIYLKQDIRIG